MDSSELQSSPLPRRRSSISRQNASSPPPRKPKRPPPITPRRFNKFFSPRTSSSSTRSSAAARRLADITHSSVNNRGYPRKTRSSFHGANTAKPGALLTPDSTPKKRKVEDPSSPPCDSSPIKRTRFELPGIDDIPSSPPRLETVSEYPEIQASLPDRAPTPEPVAFCQPIIRLATSKPRRLLERSFGGRGALGRGIQNDIVIGKCLEYWWHNVLTAVDFKDKTSMFCSAPSDRLVFHPTKGSMTFSMSSFHTKPLVVMGLEDGQILIQDTSNSEAFSKPYLYISAHANAVMDLDVSEDDSMIASASGDKIAKIIDVRTRKAKAQFDFEKDGGTVKQVRFQPGNPNVIATTCRDGYINIWDTRCHGRSMQEPEYSRPPLRAGPLELDDETTYCTTYTTPFLSIPSAHGDRASLLAFGSHTSIDAEKGHITRHSKVSVTALSFLSPDRSHMLVTGCDPSASIRVWDIRGRYNRRSGGSPVPVSVTAMPSSHATPRAFGLTSITANSNGSRLYAVGRDSIVYAYSTAHLILGHAPELDLSQNMSVQRSSLGRTGLGPLYGIRNRSLQVGSFYVKASVRQASCGKPEMIAVGSTSASPVLFPTDERDFMNRYGHWSQRPSPTDREGSQSLMDADLDYGLPVEHSGPRRTPIYELGTPLVNGHEKEVSALTWTCEGNLVTSGDDRVSRCWRDGSYKAMECRRKGLRDRDVARSGWAAVEETDDEAD